MPGIPGPQGPATKIISGSTLPATCSPGQVFVVPGTGMYVCFSANTWTILESGAGTGEVTGSGTTNTIPKWTNGSGSVLGDGTLIDNGTNILSTFPIAIAFGSTTPPAGPKLVVASSQASSPRGILSAQFSSNTSGARVGFQKARGSVSTPTTVVTGDTLGRLMFRGYDGTSYLEMGSIEVASTGTIATSRVPTTIVFSTATDANPSVLTTALTIGANQSSTFAGAIAASSTITQTSASATAFQTGPNGGTNPVLRVVNSTSSQADGISITGLAAGSGTTIQALTSGTNAGIAIIGAGTGGLTLNVGQTTSAATDFLINPTTKTSGNLIDAQKNSVSLFTVDSVGSAWFGGNDTTATMKVFGASPFDVRVYQSGAYSWSSTSGAGGTRDTVLSRQGAGVVQVGTSAANTAGSLWATTLQNTSSTANTGGGYGRTFSEATTGAMSGATASIAVNVPSGARLLGVQLRVDTLITSGAATSWSAAYATGATQSITTGQVFTKNTQVNTMFNTNAATDITTGTTTITITPNTGTFTAGVIRAVCYWEQFVAMSAAP